MNIIIEYFSLMWMDKYYGQHHLYNVRNKINYISYDLDYFATSEIHDLE